MSEETTQSGAGKGLGIAGLVIGIIALVISFIPCLGSFALIPGVVAVILSVIGVIIASKKSGAKGLTIAALIISVLACAIAGWQTKVLMDATSGLQDAAKEMNVSYDSCEELVVAYETAVDEFVAMQGDINIEDENVDAMDAINVIGGSVTVITKIANIQAKATEMNCNEDVAYQAKLVEIGNKYSEAQPAQ